MFNYGGCQMKANPIMGMRIPDSERAILQKAANYERRKLSDFVRYYALHAAKQIISREESLSVLQQAAALTPYIEKAIKIAESEEKARLEIEESEKRSSKNLHPDFLLGDNK